MMVAALAPAWLSALVAVGALSAFMSTMDSQLLALSSMLTRDLYADPSIRVVSVAKQVQVGRYLVVILAVIGLAIAYRPPETIFAIATEAFTGLAVLFPTALVALYRPHTPPRACIASIMAGEALLVGYHYELIPSQYTFGFLPLVPIMFVTLFVLVGGSISGSLKNQKGR